MNKIDVFGYVFDRKELILLICLSVLAVLLFVLLIIELKVYSGKRKYLKQIKKYVAQSENDDEEDELEELEALGESDESDSQEDSNLTRCPRRMTLRLRLNAASDQLKNRYSRLRNFLGSYKVRERFAKHRDLYFIRKENVEKADDGSVLNKTFVYKLAMITIRRKQLILSLNIETPLTEEQALNNMVIETRRYRPYNFNMKVSSEKNLQLAISLLTDILEYNNIPMKKKHKEVDYVKEFSEDLTNFELRGLGYLLRDSITLEEANNYVDSLSKKALVVNKVDEKVLDEEKEITVSLDELSNNFENDSTINLDILKEKNLVEESYNKLIITEGNFLNKKFFIDADGYATNAIKMISLVGGEARVINRVSH